MRRSLGYVAMGLILVGGAILALSEENWQSNDSLASVFSLLSPSPAHAADSGQRKSTRHELAAYYDNSATPNELKPASKPAPSTDTSSRRTLLDARFEDMSLSLDEDEPTGFRDQMNPVSAAPQPAQPHNSPAPATLAPPAQELAALPEEPAQGAFASDEAQPAADDSFAPTPVANEPTLAPMPQPMPTSGATSPTPAEPAFTTPTKQDRYAEFQPQESASPAAIVESPVPTSTPSIATAPESAPAPFHEPRRLTANEAPHKTSKAATTELQASPFAATSQPNADNTEVPNWNGHATTSAPQAVFAATPMANKPFNNDKSGASAVSVHWLTPGEVNRGDEIPCRLQVTNEGDSPAVSVAVHVQLPEHAELASATAAASADGRVLSWKLDRLEPQESKTFEMCLLPKGDGDFAPTASVTYTRAATASIHVLDPQLAVSIVGPEQALVSQPAMYQLRVSNPGTGKARNVVVQARLDANLSHPAGGELEYAIGTLGPGETRLLEVPVTGNTPGEGNILAEATSANRLSAQGGCVVEIVRPALELSLEGPKLRFVDRKAVFTLTAHNPSAVAATNVQIFGSVPAGYKYEGATAGGGFDEATGAVAWFVGRLEPQRTAKVEYELVAHDLGAHKLLAMVRADLGVEERAELDTTIEGVPSVALELSGPDAPIEVGGRATYRLEVTNRGTKIATNVQVACRIPGEMESAEMQGATSGTVSGDRIVFEPLASLAPGEIKIYEVHTQCSRPGDVRFRAFFRSDECREVVQQEALTRIYQD